MATIKQGNLSISSENIFPIIKKWMYSDHDIFLRELVSNGCDAVTKLKKIEMMGECELPEDFKPRIDVVVDPEGKTITVSDNGLGMDADEVDEYINQIAFSGAEAFLEKYKDKANSDQIIGHFGLGFYSAFMVSDSVEIETLSYKKDAKPVHWTCDGGTSFEMEEGTRSEVGTTITLHVNEASLEFCNKYRVDEVLKFFNDTATTEIYLSQKNTTETQTIELSEKLPDDEVIEEIHPTTETKEDGTTETKGTERLKIKRRPELINETHPLWSKNPAECTEEEYKEFYRKVFKDYKEPLFWIHLNMDYPLNLKGILYFPKINMEYESIEGVIKLYNNQVFIADNIKEVIPEFLLLLKGVIDCPDLPLNVSRSALQNDGMVQKISDYITKKVADKRSGMCKTDLENYEQYWNDISPFIKYGCLRDNKFCDKMNDYILFRDFDGDYTTLPDCLSVAPIDTEDEAGEDGVFETAGGAEGSDSKDSKDTEAVDAETGEAGEAEGSDSNDGKDSTAATADKEEDKEPEEKIVYYVTDEVQQSQYINMFRQAGMKAVVLKDNIDQPFLQQLESRNEGVKFMRIDADITAAMKGKTSKKDQEKFEGIAEAVQKTLRKRLGKDKLEVKIQKLKNKKVSAVITLSEESRRMQDMMKMYASGGMGGLDMFPSDDGAILTLNAGHPLVKYIIENEGSSKAELIEEQLYDLAMISNKQLSPDDMTRFVNRSNEIMQELIQ